MIPTLRGCQEKQRVMIFDDIETHFFQTLLAQVSSSSYQLTAYYLGNTIPLENQ